MSTDREFARLRALYGEMGDGELMGLAAKKAELTALAQVAVGAEMKARGLEQAVEDLPEVSAGEVESESGEWEELMMFQVPGDAETAFRRLAEGEVPARLDYALRRLVEDGPVVKTNWLSVFIEAGRREDAVRVLRREMGLFPVAEVDHHEGEEEEALLTVGSFDVEADSEVAYKALTEAGIWFQAEAMGDGPGFAGVTMEVRAEDVDRAMEVVDRAFGEE